MLCKGWGMVAIGKNGFVIFSKVVPNLERMPETCGVYRFTHRYVPAQLDTPKDAATTCASLSEGGQ